jgi:hypothetical protein
MATKRTIYSANTKHKIMESTKAINYAICITAELQGSLSKKLRNKIPIYAKTADFWMERIHPETDFITYQNLVGFVYLTLKSNFFSA